MTSEEAQQLCEYWQETLALRDWDVAVSVCREREFDAERREGEVIHQLSKKRAWIRLLDPTDYSELPPATQDHELTLVHELLHLHFSPISIPNDTLEHTCLEQAIHLLSQSLVSLHRRSDGSLPSAHPGGNALQTPPLAG